MIAIITEKNITRVIQFFPAIIATLSPYLHEISFFEKHMDLKLSALEPHLWKF